MGYCSAWVGNVTEMLAPTRGFWWSCCWMISEKFYHEWPPLAWQRNFRQTRLSYISRLVWQIFPRPLCQAI